jgi:arginyl-tRNA synthetase
MVIDSRQSFYLKQFFKTLEVMGFDKKLVHIPYEFLTLKDGAMSSRKGNIVSFEDFFEQAVGIIVEDMKERHQDWTPEEIKNIARKIALAAIKFYMLRVSNNSVITFDFEEARSYDGFTGPYLQYTVSRINSILNKESVKNLAEIDFSKLDHPKEKELLLLAMQFPEIIRNSVELLEPSQLAKYLFDLAKSFSSYYQEVPILNSEIAYKKARLSLIQAVRQTLVNGLGILGIEVLDRM